MDDDEDVKKQNGGRIKPIGDKRNRRNRRFKRKKTEGKKTKLVDFKEQHERAKALEKERQKIKSRKPGKKPKKRVLSEQQTKTVVTAKEEVQEKISAIEETVETGKKKKRNKRRIAGKSARSISRRKHVSSSYTTSKVVEDIEGRKEKIKGKKSPKEETTIPSHKEKYRVVKNGSTQPQQYIPTMSRNNEIGGKNAFTGPAHIKR